MKVCIICGEAFSRLCFGNPTEPCACGSMLTWLDAREWSKAEIAAKRAAWARVEANDPDEVQRWIDAGR